LSFRASEAPIPESRVAANDLVLNKKGIWIPDQVRDDNRKTF